MKYRKGFVTNSSSSSYICDICQSVEYGYDIMLNEIDMFTCKNDHTICAHHFVPNKTYKNFNEYVSNYMSKNPNAHIDEAYSNVPIKYCPVCTGDEISIVEFVNYFKEKFPEMVEKYKKMKELEYKKNLLIK